MQKFRLEGKSAIVTGGSKGIGFGIATALAEAGVSIALVARNQEDLERAQSTLRDLSSETIEIYPFDMSIVEDIPALFTQISTEMNGIDILVNNAGVTRDSLMLRMSEDDWDYVLDSNLKSAFLCTKAVLPQMLRQKSGRIVNISSVVGIYGNPGQSNYTAAKAGLIGLTKTTAKEVGSRGITVNAVAPGFIKTKMVAGLSTEILSEVEKRVALGRLGNTEDVAGTVAFLVSPDASFITG